ncbi:MAG: cell division protein SepF [Ruminococcaceae bacterium]|nr:cell division protein SepF [Oscillospiraceae bacterium]
MGIKESIGRIIFGNENDEEEYIDEEIEEFEEEEEEEIPTPATKPRRQEKEEAEPTAHQNAARQPSSGINVASGAPIEMKVVKPEKLENVTQIADYLISRKTVLLNLEDTQPETSRRLIDFLNGVAYAINGNLRKVANRTYVATPSNVDITGEQLTDSAEKSEFAHRDRN